MIILSYAKICIKNTFFRLKDSKNLKIQKMQNIIEKEKNFLNIFTFWFLFFFPKFYSLFFLIETLLWTILKLNIDYETCHKSEKLKWKATKSSEK